MHKTILSMVVFSWIGGFVPGAGAQNLSPADQMARDIFKQLIEINTTDSVGNVTTAAEARAERPQKESRGALSRRREAQTGPVYRPSRCCRGASPGLDYRSLRISRKRRLFLRPRHRRHERR